MFRLGRMTDYGVVLLSYMEESRVTPASELVEKSAIAAPSVAQLLKRLTRARLLVSQRGVGGGYRLARPAEQITLAEIIRALEGPIALTACTDGTSDSCTVASFCQMHGWWNRVNGAVESTLEAITLADIRREIAESPFPALPPVSSAPASRGTGSTGGTGHSPQEAHQ